MLDLSTALLATTAAINVGLVIFIYTQNRSSPINVSFSLFVVGIVLWTVCILPFNLVSSDTVALYLLKLDYVSAALIAACFYYFSIVFPEGKHPAPFHTTVVVGAAGLLCAALLVPSFLTGATIHHPWGREVLLRTPDYLIFATVFCALFLGGQLRIWWKFAKATGALRMQLLSVALSVTLVGLFGMYFNLLLPSPFYQDFRFVWTGPIFTSAFAVAVTYSIFRYRLFNAKAFLAEVLVFSLWLLMFVRLLLATTYRELLGDGAVLVVAVPIGVLLLRSVQLEIKARETLAVANDRLKELDQMKSEFLSIATHQLRGPVTAIRGYAAEVLENGFGQVPEALREPIERIAESGRLMASEIEDYLNVSRIEQGRMEYHFEIADLGPIVGSVIRELRPIATKKGLALSFDTDGKDPYPGRIDVGKIRQVVFNLVDNAIKYTPTGSVRVQLMRDQAKRTVHLSIQDTGIGIEQAVLPTLFQKFSRAEGADRVNAHGTGLGLYVARQLAEAHGAQIWASSAGVGRGATFNITIPWAT